jgi:hypothetical protein
MKKLLLAAAALMVLSASAQAKPTHVKLPDMMVGNWCLNGDNPGASLGIYSRRNAGHACDNILDVEHASYDTNEYACYIKTSRQIASSAFVVHTRCGETPDNQWTADTLFQVIGDHLHVSDCKNNRCPKFRASRP